VGDGAGLAGARAGEHDDRPPDGLGGGALLGVQRSQHVLGGHPDILAERRDSGILPPYRVLTRAVSAPLTVYSTEWCGYCHRLIKQLDREGVTYEYVDIEHDPAAAEFVMGVNGGNQTVPTVVFSDGTALTNPSVAQVLAKL
jgi:mycoredoxin